MMNRLTALLETLSQVRPDATSWCGVAPTEAAPEALFQRLSYGAEASELHDLNREDAAVWLSLLAAHSLNHGVGREETIAWLKDVELGLGDLAEDARFFSIGTWEVSRRGRHWARLRAGEPWMGRKYMRLFSGPYVDGKGVRGAIIGFDRSLAFVFDVAEDD